MLMYTYQHVHGFQNECLNSTHIPYQYTIYPIYALTQAFTVACI